VVALLVAGWVATPAGPYQLASLLFAADGLNLIMDALPPMITCCGGVQFFCIPLLGFIRVQLDGASQLAACLVALVLLLLLMRPTSTCRRPLRSCLPLAVAASLSALLLALTAPSAMLAWRSRILDRVERISPVLSPQRVKSRVLGMIHHVTDTRLLDPSCLAVLPRPVFRPDELQSLAQTVWELRQNWTWLDSAGDGRAPYFVLGASLQFNVIEPGLSGVPGLPTRGVPTRRQQSMTLYGGSVEEHRQWMGHAFGWAFDKVIAAVREARPHETHRLAPRDATGSLQVWLPNLVFESRAGVWHNDLVWAVRSNLAADARQLGQQCHIEDLLSVVVPVVGPRENTTFDGLQMVFVERRDNDDAGRAGLDGMDPAWISSEHANDMLRRCDGPPAARHSGSFSRVCLHTQEYRPGHAIVFPSIVPHAVAPFRYGASRVTINMFGVKCGGVRWWMSG